MMGPSHHSSVKSAPSVIPAKAGIQSESRARRTNLDPGPVSSTGPAVRRGDVKAPNGHGNRLSLGGRA